MAFVYGLRAKDSTGYFYIGSTKHSLEHRLKQHLDNIRLGYNKNKHLVRKVAKVGAENVVIEALEECDELIRFEREYDWIARAAAQGWRLTNVVMEQFQYEMQRRTEEFDEFRLQPYHIDAFIQAFDAGLEPSGNDLADRLKEVVELGATEIFERCFNDFLENIYHVMERAYGEQDAERQAAGVYQRIFAMLERG